MAKYYGAIGYGADGETAVDVWEPSIVERNYFGDVLQNKRRWESSEGINDNTRVSHQISIVADPYALQNFHLIRYVTWMGTKWKVTDISVEYPRMILTLGGVYNENETSTEGHSSGSNGSY